MAVRLRPWQLFSLRNLTIVGLFFLAGFVVYPSKRSGALGRGLSQQAWEAHRTPGKRRPGQAEQAQVSQRYGNLPLGFELNQGQTDSKVKFLSRGPGYALLLTG